MKFIFFAKGATEVPSSRYRAYYLAEALRKLGHEAQVTPVLERGIRSLFRYVKTLYVIPKENVIVFQRTVYNKYFFIAALVAYLRGRRWIFDIDDAVYEHSPLQSIALARLASAVTCGSEHVLTWARKYNANSHLLLNGVPLSVYTVRKSEPEEPTVGWIGNGPAHYENLAFLVSILTDFASKRVRFTFKLVGALGDSRIYKLFEKVPFPVEIIDSLDWSDPRQAVSEIHTFTVGVMPLTETTWNQAKYFKALEYMACGVPVVASTADTLSKIISEAGCGTLVQTKDKWEDALKHLLSNRELRAKEGTCGRAYIENKHSSKIIADTFLSFT